MLPIRRHVRGARSLSPQRHERIQSQPYNEPYRHRQTFSNAHDQAELFASRASLQDLARGLRNVDISDPVAAQSNDDNGHTRRASLASVGPRPLLRMEPIEVQPPNAQPLVQAAAMSEEAFEQMILDGKAYALSSGSDDIQLDWARDALRLVERQEMRCQRISTDLSSPLTSKQNELRQDALEILRRLSSSNVPRAHFAYGVLLETGRSGVPIDRRAAFTLYKQAARADFVRAEHRIGMQFECAGDMRKGCEHYEYGASKDDVACLFRLAMILLFGQCGRQPDQHKGISCLHLSALAADVDAPEGAYIWGLVLAGETEIELARDVPLDQDAAVMFIEKAAALGLPAAQQRLGRAHELNELGCEFSPALSVHYYTLAAQGDDPEGDMALSKWYLAGSDDGLIAKNEHKALFHAQLAARRGLASAEFAMGYFHEVGVGCHIDLEQAQIDYAKAAEHGSEEAKSRILGLARTGTISRLEHDFHVSTKIQARHATIKLNQQQAGKFRSRVISRGILPCQIRETAEDFSAKTISSSDRILKRNEQFNGPPNLSACTRQSDESATVGEVEELKIARKSLQGRLNVPPPQGLHAADAYHVLRRRTVADLSLEQIEPAVSPRGHRENALSVSIRRTTNDGPEHSHQYQSLDPSGWVPASDTSLREQEDSGLNRVDSWNKKIASVSYPASPNLAPSEIGSTQEYRRLGSPRPESSVSNVPPYRLSQLSDVRKSLSSPTASSQTTAPASLASSVNMASSVTTTSGSSRRAAETFEEMGIPMVNRKKEDCVVM